uniref:LOW QUALITY PROTEIN: probable membrane metalloprotease ARASP2, chloroplastic n=1 Tax=Elaeis guineensis var. tenera TaxID=51953 RepID=A0A8N4IB82_ELAGV|nr:LOW QUALITY PROTEIN: probable membrane metalloprotease ARASP2, chloroplastic [Elaeis guineensis]
MINLSSAHSPAPTFLCFAPSSPCPKPPAISFSLLKPSYSPPPNLQSLLYIGPRRRRRRRRCSPSAPRAIAALSLEGTQSVLEAASVLAAIILVHESGHFLAARLQGIHVSKFAIGFGPVLARFFADGVEYSLRAFPLGGFVGFPDDDPDSDIPTDDADLLKNRPILDRLLVISAGVAANIAFAYLIVFTQVLTVGLPVQETLPGVLVPDVRPGSAAARDGLRPGDVILAIDGAPPPSVSDLVDIVKMNPKRSVAIKVARDGIRSLELNVVPDESSDGTGRIGVQLSPNFRLSKLRPRNLAEATTFAGKEFLGLTSTVLDGLKQTFLNFSQSAGKVSGPVAIIAVGAEVARSSSDGLFQFAAVINLNLAVINLLPLPALDGGSLALLLVEAARGGRKIPREVEQRIMSSGILLVVMLGLFLIVRDTLNLDFIKEML